MLVKITLPKLIKFTLNNICQLGPSAIIIYLHSSKYVNLFLPREWECDLSFTNTTQLETIFRNKGSLTRKQVDH